MFWIIERLPPIISSPMLVIMIIAEFLWKKLTGSLWGGLVLVIILYTYTEIFTATEPFALTELIDWFSNLDLNSKTAIATSFITIIGFLVAFHAATMNWKQQLDAQTRLIAAGELDNNTNQIVDVFISMSLFAEGILDAVDSAQIDPKSAETQFKVRYEVKRLSEFEANREKLHRLADERRNTTSKYSAIFASIPRGAQHIERSNELVSVTSKAAWVTLPYIFDEDVNYISNFIQQIRKDDYRQLNELCDKNSSRLSGLSGMVSGQLKSSVIEFNFFNLLELIRNRKNIRRYIQETFHINDGGI